jgi:hypothetical protein
VARRLRILFVIGVEQRSPRWDGRKVAAVSDRLSQPFQCPDRPGMVLAAKHRFGFCGGSWRSGSPATGCTDSSSAPGRTRPQGLEAKVRRYTGTRCICPAMLRWKVWLLRRTDRWLRALCQNEASHPRRQMWPNWQAATSATKPPSPGWVRPDLDLSDRSNGKAPLPSGICQPWQEDRCLAKRAERGAARCHSLDYPTRQLTAPRPNTHGREWLWTLIKGQATGRYCRVNGEACVSGGRGF